MSRVEDLMSEGLGRLYTAAAVLAAEGEDIKLEIYKGEADGEKLGPAHLFDLASLTKPLALGTVMMRLHEEGKITPWTTPAEVLGSAALSGPQGVLPLADFLAHCSGWPGWLPFFEEQPFSSVVPSALPEPGFREEIFRKVRNTSPIYKPGEKTVYSDLGYILLTEVVERAAGERLDRLFDKLVKRRIKDLKARFMPIGEKSDDIPIVPSNNCAWRKRILKGEVEDRNAWVMGGVSGHAGLFGTARDVFKLSRAVAKSLDNEGLVPRNVAARYLRRHTRPEGTSWCLGWDTPDAFGSSSGEWFTKESTIGHLGWTGTSVWVDMWKDRTVVLLANRLMGEGDTLENFKRFRPKVHNAIFEELNWIS